MSLMTRIHSSNQASKQARQVNIKDLKKVKLEKFPMESENFSDIGGKSEIGVGKCIVASGD